MRRLLTCLPVLFFCVQLFAQPRTVTGRVIDAQGKAVPFASITVKGTSTSVAADVNGAYSIQAPPNAPLVFSSAGFAASEINIGSQTSISATLALQGALSEVVVTAMGIRRDKKALGSAVSTITSKDIEQRSEADLGRILTGKAPGLNVLNTSGLSGSGTQIVIRGISTITGTDVAPLFIIDGVPFDAGTNTLTNGGTGFYFGNQTSSRFLDIDPKNI